FYKVHRVEAHTNPEIGTGLGLALTKEMVESVHNGKLYVTSESGKGSTFTIELPIMR
ncbi:MAG: two-component sensor histidine kinase, partial [Thermoplasmata archaeon]